MCSDPAASPARRSAPALAALRALPLLAALMLASLSLAACGKKGDPRPPLRPVPQRTEGLRVEQRGLELILELPYPKVTAAGMALPGLDRVELYEVVREAPRELVAPAATAAEPAEPSEPAAAPEAAPQPAAAEGEAAAAGTAEPTAPGEPGETAETTETAPPANAAPPAVTPAAPAGPKPLDPRQFARAASLSLTLAGPELASAVVGDRIVLRVPLPQDLPASPQAHWFAIRTAVGADDRSELSNQAAIVPRSPPAAPAGLQATPRPDGVEIVWQAGTAEPDASPTLGFEVYRRESSLRDFGAPLAELGADARSWVDRSARTGTRYIYAVTSRAAEAPRVESAITAVQEVDYRDLFPPPAPTGLVALAEEGRVRLVWEGVRAADLAGYRVLRRAESEGDFHTLTADPIAASEYDDRDLVAGARYTWRVVAVDKAGNVSEPAEAAAAAR